MKNQSLDVSDMVVDVFTTDEDYRVVRALEDILAMESRYASIPGVLYPHIAIIVIRQRDPYWWRKWKSVFDE